VVPGGISSAKNTVVTKTRQKDYTRSFAWDGVERTEVIGHGWEIAEQKVACPDCVLEIKKNKAKMEKMRL